MGKYFEDIHASCDSQVKNLPFTIADSSEIAALRTTQEDGEQLIALGEALCKQLRYREAIDCFTRALSYLPDDVRIYRKRAARYLSTLQGALAKADFLRCLDAGSDELDVCYRLGLCDYIQQAYDEALQWFERAYSISDEEMGIAIIYWHTLCCYRMDRQPTLLMKYHDAMEVGHHTAYEKAVQVCAGKLDAEIALAEAALEKDDMTFAITVYGIVRFLYEKGPHKQAQQWNDKLLARDSFWICYAYLAAKNDTIY